ncbi:hypothetical protein EWM64_g3122 [Hericium alpestre]|uniref:Uncharacterized protein n=1 Tax=Hericium alpestre TaxID=135208 RepID=A0A4Z0A3S2_9AGAM|nr:hypothetical protein EWM64_g3122 [Hericium alpestre]
MSDADVQDIRELVARKKAELASAKGKDKDASQTQQAPPQQQPFVAAEDAQKKREAMTKNERLGIQS